LREKIFFLSSLVEFFEGFGGVLADAGVGVVGLEGGEGGEGGLGEGAKLDQGQDRFAADGGVVVLQGRCQSGEGGGFGWADVAELESGSLT
jgi:hypothetical protein